MAWLVEKGLAILLVVVRVFVLQGVEVKFKELAVSSNSLRTWLVMLPFCDIKNGSFGWCAPQTRWGGGSRAGNNFWSRNYHFLFPFDLKASKTCKTKTFKFVCETLIILKDDWKIFTSKCNQLFFLIMGF